MPDFLPVSTNSDDNIIGGAARILIAPLTTAVPTKIDDVIQVGTTSTAEVQTLTANGTPTSGSFRLVVDGYGSTGLIAWNAASTAIVTALATIGVTVTATGGPANTTPVVLTFGGSLGSGNIPSISVDNSAVVPTTASYTVAETTPGAGQYSAKNGWIDLGATKNGIQIVRNNSEQAWDVDQLNSDIRTFPTGWEQSVRTSLSEASLKNFAYTWETLQPALNATSGEEVLNIGAPTAYAVRRLAVAFQKPDGKIRLHFFRRVSHTPQESSVNFQKNSEQITLPVAFKCFADSSSASVDDRFGFILNQR